MEALTGNSRQIGIFEAVIDALTFVTLIKLNPEKWGNYAATAIIGTMNDLILAEMAHSGKRLSFALDNDAAGKSNAEQNIRLIQSPKIGLDPSRISNLTTELMLYYPGTANYDDLNKWWVMEGWENLVK